MPETPITRDRLLASVYVLKPGDLLVVRCPQDTNPEFFKELSTLLSDKVKPLGVEVLVMTDQLSVDVVRSDDSAVEVGD